MSHSNTITVRDVEDAFWSSRAAEVLSSGTGFVGPRKSAALLERLLTPDKERLF